MHSWYLQKEKPQIAENISDGNILATQYAITKRSEI